MLVIMVFLIIYSCSSPNIDKIEIIYLPKDLNTPISIDSCYKMYNYHYLMSDTIIKNTDFNRKLQIEINRLETDKSNSSKSIDFRIACLIIMENGDTNRLGLNTLGGIKYNDIVMKDSPNLFYLFDITLYKNRSNWLFYEKEFKLIKFINFTQKNQSNATKHKNNKHRL